MSFDFVGPDEQFCCKNCGESIELWQYRRLALCENCERPVVEAAKGTPEQQFQRALDAFGRDWEDKFLADINSWDEKRGRLR
jgi:hypothetical protein